jgi:phosphoserine phosphatase
MLENVGLPVKYRVLIDASLCRHLLGGEVVQFKGTEFKRFLKVDPDLKSIYLQARAQGKSCGLIPNSVNAVNLAFFDMDATVIVEESLVSLAALVALKDEIEKLTFNAMSLGHSFSESVKQRVKLLRGTPRFKVESVGHTCSPGIRDLLSNLQQNGVKTKLVSGGFTEMVAPVAQELCFDSYACNQFEWDSNDRLSGNIVTDHRMSPSGILDQDGKLNICKKWAAESGADANNCMAIGDGANDLLMLQFAGIGVGFNPKPILWPHVDVLNATGDHGFMSLFF